MPDEDDDEDEGYGGSGGGGSEWRGEEEAQKRREDALHRPHPTAPATGKDSDSDSDRDSGRARPGAGAKPAWRGRGGLGSEADDSPAAVGAPSPLALPLRGESKAADGGRRRQGRDSYGRTYDDDDDYDYGDDYGGDAEVRRGPGRQASEEEAAGARAPAGLRRAPSLESLQSDSETRCVSVWACECRSGSGFALGVRVDARVGVGSCKTALTRSAPSHYPTPSFPPGGAAGARATGSSSTTEGRRRRPSRCRCRQRCRPRPWRSLL